MARTTILPSDPNKRKAWAAAVAEDAAKTQYFARMQGPEGSRSAIIKKTDLEKGADDEVVTALVAKLRGQPVTEGKKLAGQEFKLSHSSHAMRINEFRHGVNVGARIEQSRVGFIRDDAGAQGWFESQKALVTAIGKEAEIFKGGAGMYNGILVDEMETCVKFSDYGAGSVAAARSLFMGANAVATAHGTKGMADGMSVALDEDTDDRKHDHILFFEMIFGADKTQFNGMDYGMITVDSAFTAAV